LDGGSANRKACTYTGQHSTEKSGHSATAGTGSEPTVPVFLTEDIQGFSWSVRINTGEYFKIGHYIYFGHSSLFVFHKRSYSTMYLSTIHNTSVEN